MKDWKQRFQRIIDADPEEGERQLISRLLVKVHLGLWLLHQTAPICHQKIDHYPCRYPESV